MTRLLICAWAAAVSAACASTPHPSTQPPAAPTATLRALPSPTQTASRLTPLPTDTLQPTPTALPTATPVAYVIQNGDTLIGIAIDHNVSLEALEAVNPGINPVNLQVGQTVLIPPASGEAAPNQAVAPTPLAVEVGPFTCSPTPVASLICLGAFVNTYDQPIANLSVTVTLLNADNTPGDSAIAYAPLDLIPPGATVPLGAVFNGGGQQTAIGAALTADSGVALTSLYTTFEVTDIEAVVEQGALNLRGTVTNPAAAPLSRVVLVATVYNSASQVAGFRKIPLIDTLAAGESVAFNLALPGVSDPARWQVVVQGRTR